MNRYLGAFAIVAPILVASVAAGPASAQKPGGILKMYSPDSPASMSIHEEATFVAEGPMMGGVQQPRPIRPARKAEQPRLDRARSGQELVMERGRDRADDAIARRCQLARRQTVHRQGCS